MRKEKKDRQLCPQEYIAFFGEGGRKIKKTINSTLKRKKEDRGALPRGRRGELGRTGDR